MTLLSLPAVGNDNVCALAEILPINSAPFANVVLIRHFGFPLGVF